MAKKLGQNLFLLSALLLAAACTQEGDEAKSIDPASSGYLSETSRASSNSYAGSPEGSAEDIAIGSVGTTYHRIGNSIIGSDGTTYRRIGNTTLGSDGTTYRTIGNTTIGSDGTTYRRIGNTTLGSDGSVCRTIGNTVIC